MIKTIYLVGNLLVEEDSIPLKLKSELQKAFKTVEFKEFDPTEDLPDDLNELVMIDSIEGINKSQSFEDVDRFMTQKNYSMHDFDLGWQLKLAKKMGKLYKVKIIGVPQKGDLKKILEEVKSLISN